MKDVYASLFPNYKHTYRERKRAIEIKIETEKKIWKTFPTIENKSTKVDQLCNVLAHVPPQDRKEIYI